MKRRIKKKKILKLLTKYSDATRDVTHRYKIETFVIRNLMWQLDIADSSMELDALDVQFKASYDRVIDMERAEFELSKLKRRLKRYGIL